MRKYAIAVLTAMVLLVFSGTAAAATKVFVNGKQLALDVSPVTVDGRMLVPVRQTFEALGVGVQWNQKTKQVSAAKGGTMIILTLNKKTAVRNGYTLTLDTPARMIQGRVMVPLRFVSESFAARLNWDTKKEAVYIVTDSSDAASSAPTAPPVSSAVTKPAVSTPITPAVKPSASTPDVPAVSSDASAAPLQLLAKPYTYYAPSDLNAVLTSNFGKDQAFNPYTFTIDNPAPSKIVITMEFTDTNPDKAWLKVPTAYKESFIRNIMNQLTIWYPDKEIELTVFVTAERQTKTVTFGDQIVKYTPPDQYIVRDRYTGATSLYQKTGSSVFVSILR